MILNKKLHKIILSYLVKKYNIKLFTKYLFVFHGETYRVIFRLMQRGYLTFASELIKNFKPTIEEQYLVDRIKNMIHIKNEGLVLKNNSPFPKVDKVSVLFVAHNSLPYENAGYALRTHKIVGYLRYQNIECFVVTRPGFPWDLQKHKGVTVSNERDMIDNVVYYRLLDEKKTFKKGPDSVYLETYAKELIEFSKRRKITILHANSNYMNAIASIYAAKVMQVPVLYEIRGLWHLTRVSLDKKFKEAGMYAYEEEMEKAAARSANCIVTISKPLKERIMEWGISSNKITIIPNSVNINMFEYLEPNKKLMAQYNLNNHIVIGFIGSLTHYEGLSELILSVEELLKDKLKISLIIVGDGKEKIKLEKLAKSKNIIFIGKIPFNEVQKYYSIFDICPFPRNDYEVCRYVPPLKILEAMSMKKAVIVSDVPPLLEIVKDKENGLVCKADDKESLKNVILQLYKNKPLRVELGENARNWVEENHSLHEIGKQYIKLYNTLKKKNKDGNQCT